MRRSQICSPLPIVAPIIGWKWTSMPSRRNSSANISPSATVIARWIVVNPSAAIPGAILPQFGRDSGPRQRA